MFATHEGYYCQLHLLGTDDLNDIAILKCDSKIPYIPYEFGTFSIGDSIQYFGWDRINTKVAPKIVSNVAEIYMSGLKQHIPFVDRRLEKVFSFSPSELKNIPFGFSGGPIFNSAFKLIGMMKLAWKECPEDNGDEIISIGAVPSEEIEKFIKSLHLEK